MKCEIGEHGYCTNRDGCNRNEIEENLYNPGRYTAMLIQIQYYAFNDKEKFISYPDILLQFMCRTSWKVDWIQKSDIPSIAGL